jgi:hypothetical protein
MRRWPPPSVDDVRRRDRPSGDYVSDPVVSRYHPACTPAYYHAAADRVLAAVAHPHFFVFSDDPAWAQAHLHCLTRPPSSLTTAGAPHETFRLMSFCRHHIIANSSFSWWGAWLAEQRGKS